MTSWFTIPLAFILDQFIGDPQNLPHPVRWIGQAANLSETFWSQRLGRTRAAGLLGLITVFLLVLTPVITLLFIASLIHPVLELVLSIILIYFSFALKDLNQHGWNIYQALKTGDLSSAKIRLSWIVSRETKQMDEEEVIRSTLESLSENFLDSVVAPLIFAAIFGPVGAVFYRTANTLDAMWGYKNERFLQFGFFAAKLDDLLNWIPARLSALLLLFTSIMPGYSFTGSLKTILKDAKKHTSPNSGYPEAAAAGALQAGFGGEAVYFNRKVKKPEIGKGKVKREQIKKLIQLNSISSISLTLILSILSYYSA